MSDTYKTRPYWVIRDDPRLRRFFYHYADQDGKPLFWSWKRWGSCKNPRCCGNYFRHLSRRQERVQWRAIRQRLLAGEEIDVGPIKGSAW